MNENLISVIIPIYNVEKYLEKCLNSVVSQTYSNIEIILVDDGSPDRCGEICDEYAKKDSRIKVIHKENGGLSDARNRGIDIAKGKYITFVDSDDYIDINYIEKLYNAIKENGTIISQCNIRIISENGKKIKDKGYETAGIKDGKCMIKDVNNGYWYNMVVWNKMYLTKLFDNIRFPVGKLHEDEFTTYHILYDIENIAIITETLYFYRQTEKSITNNFNLNRLDAIAALKERLKFFEEKKETELYYLTLQNLLEIIRKCYINVKKYMKNEKNLQVDLLKEYKKIYIRIKKYKNIKVLNRFKLAIFYYMPNTYFIVYKILKKPMNFNIK